MATVSLFGSAQLTTAINGRALLQIILSADEQHYIILAVGANAQVIQTNLDGTSYSVLFTLNTSLFPFNDNTNLAGITYNPSKTKFIIVLSGTFNGYPGSHNYVVEINLDGTNPVVKMNDTTKISGTNNNALSCPQCITLTADQQYYLITMYESYGNNTWNIIKVPVNDMSNPTIFATNAMFNRSSAPQQLSYMPNGNFIYPSYDGNSIYTMNSDGTNVTLLYTAADLGISLPWGPIGMLRTKDGSGYLIAGYDSKNIIKLTESSPPSSPPDAPTSLSWVDQSNGTVSVSFTPGSDNGDAIINYSYSLNNGVSFTQLDPAQATSPLIIDGLANRTNYTLLLKAINSVGPSAASAPLSFRYMCFLEGTKILCYDPESKQEIERPIESLRKGDLVKTCLNGYKPIDTIGTSKIYNPANSMRSLNRLYRCPKENYPSLTEDLVITGCHSILVKDITDEERATLIDIQEKIYVTEKHYRLIAAADKKAVPYEQEGVFNIWHIALEHPQYTFNYGVYANGLLVESSSMRMMREMSGMNLVQ